MSERITVKRAAELTGMSELFIREGVKQGRLEFGRAIKSKSGEKYCFHISPKKLEEYLGIQDKMSAENEETNVHEYKLKQMQERIDYLTETVRELKVVINSIIDAQEYLFSKARGEKVRDYSFYNSAIRDFKLKPVYIEKEEMVTVKRTAQLTGMSELIIRFGLIDGSLKFGYATKKQLYNGSYKMEYHIYAKKLAEYLGLTIEQVKGEIEIG